MRNGLGIETQIDLICSAIQYVCYDNGIYLRQMRKSPNLPSELEHLVAVGDTVITIGSTPTDFSQWKKAITLEEQVSAKIAEFMGLNGLHITEIEVKLYPYNNMIIAEVSRPEPALVTWGEVEKEAGDLILIGRDKRRKPVFLDLEKVPPGILVVGSSGSGKSNLMRLITAQAAKHDIDIYIACLKGQKDWQDLIPLARATAFNNRDGSILLDKIQLRVNKRNEQLESSSKLILLVWDEAAYPVTDRDNQERLGSLAMTCRSSNVVILAGAQTADKEIKGAVKANLKNRFAFKTANAALSATNTGVTRLGAEKLAPYEMYSIIDSYPERVSVPRADEADIKHLVDEAVERRKNPIVKKKDELKVKTLGELLDEFAIKEIEEDARRIPPIAEAMWAAIFYWRRGRKPTKSEINRIVRLRTGVNIATSKIPRIMSFVDKYADYCQSLPVEERAKIGGIFTGSQFQNTSPKDFIKDWK